MALQPIIYDVDQWLEENQKFFTPPICNKLMYKDGQLKTFFVGGPNSRKDFHMEEGEEFFYMLKGDMRLVVYEQKQFRDIIIKEGEVFLLPRRIPHSPQRIENTIGLVIERERLPTETDCLRYYVEGSDEILYEKWFYCESLEELGPLIKEYFESEQFKTGKPIPGTILNDKPIKQDHQRKLDDSFSLKEWMKRNDDEIDQKLKKPLFSSSSLSRINILAGAHGPEDDFPETFLYQMRGVATLEMGGVKYELKENQTSLIPKKTPFILNIEEGGRCLSVVMNQYLI